MMKNCENEARSRWGATDAYCEHEQKTRNYTKEKWAEANDGMMEIFAEFSACKGSGALADSSEAQALVAKLQHTSPPTTTPAQTSFSQALARCTLPTSDLRRTSTSTVRVLRNLRQRQ